MTALGDRRTESITMMRTDFDRLRGRLFQALESFGLEDRQEAAAKGIVRRLSYDMQSELEKHLRQGE